MHGLRIFHEASFELFGDVQRSGFVNVERLPRSRERTCDLRLPVIQRMQNDRVPVLVQASPSRGCDARRLVSVVLSPVSTAASNTRLAFMTPSLYS